MAVEALKLIREGEEEARELIKAAKISAAKIIADAEKEVTSLKERAREYEKSMALEISDKYANEGEAEEKAILKKAKDEAEKRIAIAQLNLDRGVNIVTEKILGRV